MKFLSLMALSLISYSLVIHPVWAGDEPRIYQNTLQPIKNAKPLLADHPEFVQPIEELRRFESPLLVDDADADLSVRAWRFSYNARGIIEMPNRISIQKTAVIMVHPWGLMMVKGGRHQNQRAPRISVLPKRII